MKPTIRTRGPLVMLVALFAALLIAACGGSSSGGSGSSKTKNASSTTTTKGATATRTALASCLKQHGVTFAGGGGGFGRFRNGTTTNGTTTNGTPPTGTTGGGGFPGGGAPGSGGSGGFPGGGGGFAARNSKFAKAFTACDKKLGIKAGAGFGPGGRRFGTGSGAFRPHISTAALKSYVSCIRKNGYAAMPEPKASSNGSFFPKSVESNAEFQTANKKCQSILLKAFRSLRPGAGGTGTQTTTSTISVT